MRCLDEATATALGGEATIPISSAWACCFLVSACTSVLDFERASEWCDRIAEFADRYGSRYMLAFCRAEYGAVAALARPLAARRRSCWRPRSRTSRARAPRGSGARPTALAELRRRQGRETGGGGCSSGPAPRARPSSAAPAWRSTEATHAARPSWSTALLRQAPARPAARPRAGARAARPRVRLPRRARAGGERRWRSFSEIERRRGHRGAAGLRGPRGGRPCAAAGGDHERARALLEDAIDGYERSRAPVRGRHRPARARHEPRRAGSSRGGGARGGGGARRACSLSALPRRRERAAATLAAPTARTCRCRSSRRGSARCCACSPRGSRTARSPSAS